MYKYLYGEEISINKLLVIGAGGHGRCCLDIARESYDHIAFLDDNLLNKEINDCKIIDTIDNMDLYCQEYKDIFIAVGNNKLRKKLIEQANKTGFNIISLISKKSTVSEYAQIDKGTVIFPGSVVESNSFIGRGCIITANTTINHDAIIEDYVLIYSNTVIKPNTLIGSYTRIGSSCTVTFGTGIKASSDIPDGTIVKDSSEYCFEMGV